MDLSDEKEGLGSGMGGTEIDQGGAGTWKSSRWRWVVGLELEELVGGRYMLDWPE